MLVSEIQHESAIGMCMSLPSWTSLPPPTLSYASQLSQSTGLSSLCYIAALCFTYDRVYVSLPVSQFVPSSPSPPVSRCPQLHSLHLCLYSCPANRFSSDFTSIFITFCSFVAFSPLLASSFFWSPSVIKCHVGLSMRSKEAPQLHTLLSG